MAQLELFDDEFAAHGPASGIERQAGWMTCVVADLARLMQARKYLLQGVEQVVWVDADVIVFDPGQFRIPSTRAFATAGKSGCTGQPQASCSRRTKSTMQSAPSAGSPLADLTEYIDRCLKMVAEVPRVSNGLMVGTDVLTSPFSGSERIENVGIMSPALLQAILREEDENLTRYTQWHGSPVFAANLCNVYRSFYEAPGLFDYLLEQAILRLLATKGGILSGNGLGAVKG